MCMNSIIHKHNYLVRDNELLVYLPPSKLRQDHLELCTPIFGHSNDNPTAERFEAAFKRVIIPGKVKDDDGGNCLPLEHIQISFASSSAKKPASVDVILTTAQRGLDGNDQPVEDSPDIFLYRACTAEPGRMSNLGVPIIARICGFVARILLLPLKCSKCSYALTVSATPPMPAYSLIRHKTWRAHACGLPRVWLYFSMFLLDHRKFFCFYSQLTMAPAPTP